MPKTTLFNREQVLEDSLKVFWTKGFHGTSMQDLVDATGLNRSSIYNSFTDKFSLYLETLRFYRSQQQRRTRKLMLENSSAMGVIRHLFQSGISPKNTKNEEKGCFFVNCTTELTDETQPAKSLLAENKDDMLMLLSDLIVQAQSTGDIDPKKDSHSLALYLFSSIQGLRLTSLLEDDPQKLAQLVDTILDSL